MNYQELLNLARRLNMNDVANAVARQAEHPVEAASSAVNRSREIDLEAALARQRLEQDFANRPPSPLGQRSEHLDELLRLRNFMNAPASSSSPRTLSPAQRAAVNKSVNFGKRQDLVRDAVQEGAIPDGALAPLDEVTPGSEFDPSRYTSAQLRERLGRTASRSATSPDDVPPMDFVDDYAEAAPASSRSPSPAPAEAPAGDLQALRQEYSALASALPPERRQYWKNVVTELMGSENLPVFTDWANRRDPNDWAVANWLEENFGSLRPQGEPRVQTPEGPGLVDPKGSSPARTQPPPVDQWLDDAWEQAQVHSGLPRDRADQMRVWLQGKFARGDMTPADREYLLKQAPVLDWLVQRYDRVHPRADSNPVQTPPQVLTPTEAPSAALNVPSAPAYEQLPLPLGEFDDDPLGKYRRARAAAREAGPDEVERLTRPQPEGVQLLEQHGQFQEWLANIQSQIDELKNLGRQAYRAGDREEGRRLYQRAGSLDRQPDPWAVQRRADETANRERQRMAWDFLDEGTRDLPGEVPPRSEVMKAVEGELPDVLDIARAANREYDAASSVARVDPAVQRMFQQDTRRMLEAERNRSEPTRAFTEFEGQGTPGEVSDRELGRRREAQNADQAARAQSLAEMEDTVNPQVSRSIQYVPETPQERSRLALAVLELVGESEGKTNQRYFEGAQRAAKRKNPDAPGPDPYDYEDWFTWIGSRTAQQALRKKLGLKKNDPTPNTETYILALRQMADRDPKSLSRSEWKLVSKYDQLAEE